MSTSFTIYDGFSFVIFYQSFYVCSSQFASFFSSYVFQDDLNKFILVEEGSMKLSLESVQQKPTENTLLRVEGSN